MFCSECGTKVNDGAKFCFNCGAKITGNTTDGDKIEKAEKEISEEFKFYVESKIIESYIADENVASDLFLKKAKFYEVEDAQVDRIVAECEGKINKFEKFMDSVYEECTLFELDENEEVEIIGFGNSLGFDDGDIEELMVHYDEVHHIEEKQELYSECILKYIDDGQTHIEINGKIEEYQLEVYKVFENNILQMEELLKRQYESAKEYELSQEQLDLIYSEGDKMFPKETVVGIIYSYDKKTGVLKIKEEREKQKALERMTIFKPYGKQIAYTEEENTGINIGKNYRKVFQKINNEFLAFYNSADVTKEGYWDDANEKVLALLDAIYKAIIATLEKKGVSNEDVSNINYMDVFEYWIPIFEDIDYKYNVICYGTEAAEYYRKLRKETRRRLVGGGFGLGGAIKGIATAGAINMLTGAAHSAFNFAGNIKSEWKKLQNIKELFGYSLIEKVAVMFQNTIQWAYLTELHIMENYNISSKSFRLFYDKNESESNVNVEIFQSEPFNEGLYENAIMNLGVDKEIDKLAEFSGIEIKDFNERCLQKEREERSADGIEFSTVSDKEAYCKERDIYKPLLDEIKQMSIWVDKQMFTEKINVLKQINTPTVKQWKEEKDNVLKWCAGQEEDFNTPNALYLTKIMKVAKSESWQETVVREGHSNYDSLLNYFKNVFEFDCDEKIVLFITSCHKEPSQALIFGTKYIYFVKSEEKLQFDYEQLCGIKYQTEKGFILNDKIICLEISLADKHTIILTSLFASRGGSNYAISEMFVKAINECIEEAEKKHNARIEHKVGEPQLPQSINKVIKKMGTLDQAVNNVLAIREPIDKAIGENDIAYVWDAVDSNTYAIYALESYYQELCSECINKIDEVGINNLLQDVIKRREQGNKYAEYIEYWLKFLMYREDKEDTTSKWKYANKIIDLSVQDTCISAVKFRRGYLGLNDLYRSTTTNAETLYYLKAALDEQHPSAFSFVGEIYYKGMCGVTADWELAKYYLTIGEAYGSPRGRTVLAEMKKHDIQNNPKDNQESVPLNRENRVALVQPQSVKDKNLDTQTSSMSVEKASNIIVKSSSDNNDLQKKYDMAVAYEEGKSGERDIKKAIELYRELAEMKIPEAQWRLGKCYNSGDGIEKDQKKAFALFAEAANQEYADAQGALGTFYSTLFSYPADKNDERAVALFIKAAEKGCLSSQCNLAIHYYQGLGVKEDKSQAIYWWTQAAKQGNVIAQYNLGQRYEYGEGVERSKEKALYWYDEAAKQGYKKAIESAKKLREGCYITTAVCKSFGKADDCYELQMFRKFRDQWLKCQSDGEMFIQEYYRTAPIIVEKINSKDKSNLIYEEIWNKYLKTCLYYIEIRQYEPCKKLYIQMVQDMKKLFVND